MTDAALKLADRRLALVEVALRHQLADAPSRRDELKMELDAVSGEVAALVSDDSPEALLAARCGLSEFERDVLWLACAPHLEPELRAWLVEAHKNLLHDFVDAAFCLRLYAGGGRPARLAARRSFEPDAPLLHNGLLRLAPRDIAPHNAMHHELVPADWVPGFLLGRAAPGHALAALGRRIEPSPGLAAVSNPPGSLDALVRLLRGFEARRRRPVDAGSAERLDVPRGLAALVIGGPGSGRGLLVKTAAAITGRAVLEVDGARLVGLPLSVAASRVVQLVHEAAVRDEIVLLRRADALAGSDSALAAHLGYALTDHDAAVMLCVESGVRAHPALLPVVVERLELPARFDPETLSQVWRDNLAAVGIEVADDLSALADRLAVTGGQARAAARLAAVRASADASEGDAAPVVAIAELEAAALKQLTSEMGHLAEIEDEVRSLDELILGKGTRHQVEEIVSAVAARTTIMREWGLRKRLRRGIGICCLFDGDPGTGKTLAGEVIASAVGLKLMRVNVPGVVDKYIGETEKNLSRIFERARPDTTMLLFDEADSLFSKRTEVTRSTDRYANMEINVLLQLIERYEGVTILTTNLKQSIDAAFERRITFKVNFKMPGKKQRKKIWRHLIPPEMPLEEPLDYDDLADAELSGGEIKNALLRAAYAAAHAKTLISMDHLLEAAHREAASAGRLVRGTEF